MKIKNIRKVDFTKKVETAIENVKTSANKANNFALKTTEETVNETIAIAGQWQNVSEKAIKGSLRLMDNQQNLFFDSLESYKKHFVKGKERLSNVFA